MTFVDPIRDRQLVAFTYDNLPRVIQPATYGYTSAGNLALRGCLVGGQSKRNALPCWELYTEVKMVDIQLLDENFADFELPGYTRSDSAFSEIIAEH